MTKAKHTPEEIARARAFLLEHLAPKKGRQTLFALLRSRARSGMSRVVSFLIPATIPAGCRTIADVSRDVALLTGYPLDPKTGGIKIGGCGYDVAHHITYALGSVLWPEGTPRPHSERNGQPDRAGGYTILSRWL